MLNAHRSGSGLQNKMYFTPCQQPVLMSQHMYILFCSNINCAILLSACLHSSTLILHQLRHASLKSLYILLTRQQSSSSEARERKTIPGQERFSAVSSFHTFCHYEVPHSLLQKQLGPPKISDEISQTHAGHPLFPCV